MTDYRRLSLALSVALLVIVSAVSAVSGAWEGPIGTAQAVDCGDPPSALGRRMKLGYYQNLCDRTGGSVLSGGLEGEPQHEVHSAAAFKTVMHNYLYGSLAQDRTGASFIINAMLGRTGPSFGTNGQASVNAGITYARNNFDYWSELVDYYARNGWIRWDTVRNYPPGFLNSYWQGPCGATTNCADGGGADPHDDAFYIDEDGDIPRATIIFLKPGGDPFYIKKNCGNIVDGFGPLEKPDFDVRLTADRNGSPFTVTAGGTYSIGADLVNKGPANTPGDDSLQIKFPATGVNRPCATTCTPAGMTALTHAQSSAHGFRNFSTIPGVAGPNWYWTVKPMIDGRTTGGTAKFTVSPTAAVGSLLTFDVYYYKGDLDGARRHAVVQYRVVSQRFPGVAGINGDVHAGGGICGGALSPGSIKGGSGATSYGEYIVSAVGTIGNFGSNNSAASTALSVGQYAPICRPDLFTAATEYRSKGVGYNTIGGTSATIDLGCLTTVGAICGKAVGGGEVYYFDGASLYLSGQVNRKVTIVTTSGNVYIIGPITLDAAEHSSKDAPSLGIISKGDILIGAAAVRVDAYLFANGIIDTCLERGASCNNNLLVNGFLMAKNMVFHRLGPANTNGKPITELVILNPQIYLNPPKLFDSSVDEILLLPQGERPPLF